MIDVFTRQWLVFVLAGRATRREAIMAVTNAVAAAGHAPPGLTLRVDNELQYTSREFRSSMASLGINLNTSTHQSKTDTLKPSTRRSKRNTSGRASFQTSKKPEMPCLPHSRTTTTAEYTLP